MKRYTPANVQRGRRRRRAPRGSVKRHTPANVSQGRISRGARPANSVIHHFSASRGSRGPKAFFRCARGRRDERGRPTYVWREFSDRNPDRLGDDRWARRRTRQEKFVEERIRFPIWCGNVRVRDRCYRLGRAYLADARAGVIYNSGFHHAFDGGAVSRDGRGISFAVRTLLENDNFFKWLQDCEDRKTPLLLLRIDNLPEANTPTSHQEYWQFWRNCHNCAHYVSSTRLLPDGGWVEFLVGCLFVMQGESGQMVANHFKLEFTEQTSKSIFLAVHRVRQKDVRQGYYRENPEGTTMPTRSGVS